MVGVDDKIEAGVRRGSSDLVMRAGPIGSGGVQVQISSKIVQFHYVLSPGKICGDFTSRASYIQAAFF
jgi:hypothetical protein